MNEAIHKAAWESDARNNTIDCNINDRARFQFEAGSDDDKMEDQIDDKLRRYPLLIIRV
jgi:hypothetical protein